MPEIYSCYGCECGGFGAQAGCAEVYGDETPVERGMKFIGRKIAFRAYQYGYVTCRTGLQHLGDGPARMSLVFEAAGDQAKALFRRPGYEFFYGDGLRQFRNPGLQGLLAGGKQYLLQSFPFEDTAFGVLPDERGYDVHSYFDRLFREPLETLVVLGRTDSHVQHIRVRAPSAPGLDYFRGAAFRGRFAETAYVERALSVYDVDAVSAPVSQHFDAVKRLLGVEAAYARAAII